MQSENSLVKSASAELSKVGLQTTTKVLEDHPRIAVAEYAKEWGADLVLVGSHGTSSLVRFLLGSVAQATVRRSPCSVEIVRKHTRDSRITATAMKILVAADSSDCATAAVKFVAQRPWPEGSQICVISVIPFVIPTAEVPRLCWRRSKGSCGSSSYCWIAVRESGQPCRTDGQ